MSVCLRENEIKSTLLCQEASTPSTNREESVSHPAPNGASKTACVCDYREYSENDAAGLGLCVVFISL